MSARDRPQDGDQNDQYRTGRKRVTEHGKSYIFGQRFGHNARADDGSD